MITTGKDGVFSPFCSQLVSDGLLLNLQVHGDQNSIKQNITYNPVEYLFPLFFLFFTAATLTTTIGAYRFILEAYVSFQECRLQKNSLITPQKVGPALDYGQNALYFFTCNNWILGGRVSDCVSNGGIGLAKSCSSLVNPPDGSIY